MRLPQVARGAILDFIWLNFRHNQTDKSIEYGVREGEPANSQTELKMTTLELKLNLPDRLAQDAAQMGLLDPDSLQTMLREAVRSRRIAQLALARQRVAEAGIAPMSLEEIQAEVDAARAERRNEAAR